MKRIYQNKNTIYLALLSIITIIIYLNSFKNEFVYDDHTHILNNLNIRYMGNIPKFFISPYLGGLYRPLRTLHYMLIYSLFDEHPFGYHLNSLLFHIANTIMVYLIINLLLKRKNIAFLSSLLFSVHPIHTERVTNITASFDQLGIFLIFLSFYLYLLYSKKEKRIYFLLSAIVFILALLSSEEAIILPLLLPLYELFSNKINIRQKFKKYSIFFVIGSFYIILRFFILKIGATAADYTTGNAYSTILTTFKVFLRYIWLLFFPFRLTLYHQINTSNSIFDFQVISSLLILLLLVYIAIKQYNKTLTFIIGWFFITLLPFSNLIPSRILMAERYLYIPSFAFCLLLGIFIHKLYNLNKNVRIITIIFLITLVVLYSTITIKRNTEWKDDLTLWTKTVKVSPLSSEAHDNLGFAYERTGFTDKAILEFKKSVELNPSNYKAYTNLGTAYAKKGNFTLAENYLKIAIKIEPNYYKAYNYLGLIYAKQGFFNKSIIEFKKAINAEPNFDEAYYNLGIVYEYIKEEGLARQEFQKAFKLNPKDPIYIQKIKSIG